MILVTKTSDQTRQRGYSLSTCVCMYECKAGAFFGRNVIWNIIFRERYKRSATPNVLRSIVVSLQLGCFEQAGKVRRLATMKAAEVNGCQGTP